MLSAERLGKFTASSAYKLFVGGKGVTRDKYVFEKADEMFRGHPKRTYTTKSQEHGLMNEYEAIQSFNEVTGLTSVYLDQAYFPINENCGSTPDAAVKDFNDVIVASLDAKCPTEKFSEQKYMIIKEAKPEFQNSPKEMFYQAQMQMMSLTAYNLKLGHPPVKEHYLARYLTKMDFDDLGNKYEYDIPLNVRMFYKIIKADEKVQKEIIELVNQASKERDLIVEILRKPIN